MASPGFGGPEKPGYRSVGAGRAPELGHTERLLDGRRRRDRVPSVAAVDAEGSAGRTQQVYPSGVRHRMVCIRSRRVPICSITSESPSPSSPEASGSTSRRSPRSATGWSRTIRRQALRWQGRAGPPRLRRPRPGIREEISRCGGRGRWQEPRRPRPPAGLWRALLRGLRLRSGRQQRRGRLPEAHLTSRTPSRCPLWEADLRKPSIADSMPERPPGLLGALVAVPPRWR